MSDIRIKDIKPTYNVTFHGDNGEVGRLFWDDGVMEFEGNAKKSAEKFFEFLKEMIDGYIKEEKKK